MPRVKALCELCRNVHSLVESLFGRAAFRTGFVKAPGHEYLPALPSGHKCLFQAFADDLSIIIIGKFALTVCELEHNSADNPQLLPPQQTQSDH